MEPTGLDKLRSELIEVINKGHNVERVEISKSLYIELERSKGYMSSTQAKITKFWNYDLQINPVIDDYIIVVNDKDRLVPHTMCS